MGHQISARVSDDLHEAIEAVSLEINGTKADAIRHLLERGVEYDELEEENERLRDQLAAVNRRIDETNEIVEYVEEERDLQQRERERREAPIWRRAHWWVFGRSD